jgi:hypothetical protein
MASDEDGVVLAGFSFGGSVPAGGYVANAATALTGGSVVASVPFNLTGAGAPSQARGGDLLILTGTGFAPNTAYALRVQSEDRKTTINFSSSDLQSDGDGVILSGFSLASSRPTGVYIAEVVSKGTNPTVLAGSTFTLRAANLQTSGTSGGAPVGRPVPLGAVAVARPSGR